MIEMYKICYGLYDRNATAGLFERNDRDSRGNACKVVVCKANLEKRKKFFHGKSTSRLEQSATGNSAKQDHRRIQVETGQTLESVWN